MDGIDPATVTMVVGVVLGLAYGFALIHFMTDAFSRRDLGFGAKVFWAWAMVGGFVIGIAAYYFLVYRKRR